MRSYGQLGFLHLRRNPAKYLIPILLVWLWRPDVVSAQSVTLTGPLAPVTTGEGDDFATRVLNNPWDFNEPSDLGWIEGYVGSSVVDSGGVWQATNQVTGAYVLPLFPEFKGVLQTVPLPGDKGLPAVGIGNPINADKYSYLCYRLNVSNRSTYALYWSNNPASAQYWPDGSNKAVRIDGVYTSSGHVLRSGWEIYCHDMKNLAAPQFEQVAGSWSGNIIGLRLDPSVFGPAGTSTSIDWMRVVDPDSSPKVTISWNQASVTSNDLVTVYLDSNNSGYDGNAIFRFSSSETSGLGSKSVELPTAALPPGTYNFYVGVRRYDANRNPVGPESYSAYSASVTVSSAPQGYITAPAMNSGDEYFLRENGNPIDMDGPEDIPNNDATTFPQVLRQYSNASFISSPYAQDGRLFQATADVPWPGNPHGDNQLWLPINQSKRPDTSHYRYFAYRMYVDPSQYADLADRVNDGWVSRPVWWNTDIMDNANAGDPSAAVTRTGWQNYFIDLATIPVIQRGQPWTAKSSWKYMRFDPLENTKSTWFWIDWIRLYAENRTSNNEYTISFNVSDADSASVNVSLYYDTDKSGFDGTLITTMNGLSPGNYSYIWNTSGLPEGNSYYVYMVITDGTSTAKFYSTVHVKIGDYIDGGVGQTGRLRGDRNGDSISEVCLASNGIVKKRASKKHVQIRCRDKFGTNVVSPLLNVSLANSKLVDMDMDGDAKGDWVMVNEVQPNSEEKKLAKKTGIPVIKPVFWVIHSSQNNKYKVQFGQTGDIPVPGDYFGTGSDNIAMFRQGWWLIRKADGSVVYVPFGQAGDIPAGADFDGDGKTDIAIFRPSTGEFWVRKSSNAETVIQQFGGSGDFPVPMDMDGDAKADYVVWRTSEAQYYIRLSSNNSVFAIPLGAGSLKPMKGLDLDGDGKMDLVNYGNNGSFLAQTSGAEMLSITLGSAGHVAPESF